MKTPPDEYSDGLSIDIQRTIMQNKIGTMHSDYTSYRVTATPLQLETRFWGGQTTWNQYRGGFWGLQRQGLRSLVRSSENITSKKK